jgi:hypothetical protein
MRRLIVLSLLAAAITFCVAPASSATPVDVGSGWQVFHWYGSDVPYDSPFTFTAAVPVLVTVTDWACVGDRFTISDGATTLGVTSPTLFASCDYPGWTSDADAALADPNYSHGRFAVGSGDHSLGIVVSTSPFGFGDAAIRFDAMSKDECKDGGWQTVQASPPFKNQGDCVSFVATQGKNQPGG